MSWAAYGKGTPVTLIVPGLAATPGEARIPASGLNGTRVVMTLPGHGDEPDAPAGYWRYSTLAKDVLLAADTVKARNAIGVSLGAGALTRVVVDEPDRFDKLVLMLPAVLDSPRPRVELQRLTTEDPAELRALVAEPLPAGHALGSYVEERAAALTRLRLAILELENEHPIDSLAELGSVSSEVLVIGAVGDPLHPEDVARATAKAFPHAQLEIFPSPAPLITHRAQIRALLQEFTR